MPSPFPGMDPFLENQEWEDFHGRFSAVAAEVLSPLLRPTYFVRIKKRVYVEHPGTEPESMRIANVAIVSHESSRPNRLASGQSVAQQPAVCTLPMPEERREAYLVIRERASTQVITVIELLSPANKRPGGDGRRAYLSKREQILASPTHLVEIDLLRGGLRLPVLEALPPADYFCIVSRAWQRPQADLYGWTVRQDLPTIPIPLKDRIEEVPLPLQDVFKTVYERAGYDLSVDYRADLDPAPDDDTAQWIRMRVT